ncbi:MAG: GtrA family protein [Patescibacteria group bacterium]
MTVASRKDFYVVSIIGAAFGLLLIPILENIKPEFWSLNIINALLLVVGFFIFANFALTIGGWLGQRMPIIWQFVKYAAVGSLNALLDIGILNLLSVIFKIYSGVLLAIFNSISIAIAITNSYLLNRFWSFSAPGKTQKPLIDKREFFRFIIVSGITIIFNTAGVYTLTTLIGAPKGVSEPLWENISKLSVAPITIAINFLGYKFFVFKP